ncbi:MAG: septum formation protein Maf [Treponema sp.]|jgi:septum formation protein|nr:septum formation protein Maf [Treponema sp.]HBB43326.1 septum formation protein Maf [Treponema sp.]
MDPIILASSSPRRQEILKLLNIPFIVHPADIDESYPEDINPEDVAEYLATAKIKSILKSLPPDQEVQWILGADTVIIYNEKIYGKPSSQEEAAGFLHEFQGNTHKVVTGLSLYNGATHDFTSRTNKNSVTFAPMTDEEIDWYISTGEWHGVAGAYRVQGLASCFISKLEGSESGVMGLPMFELYDMLKEQGYSLIELE